MNTEEKLDKYAFLQERVEWLQTSLAELKDKAIPKEVKDKLAEIDAEYDPMIGQDLAAITLLLEEIKAEVLTAGSTAKGTRYMAIWNKGRTSWDGDMLKGMVALIPQLKEAMKVGEPTVSIRQVK